MHSFKARYTEMALKHPIVGLSYIADVTETRNNYIRISREIVEYAGDNDYISIGSDYPDINNWNDRIKYDVKLIGWIDVENNRIVDLTA